MQPQGLTLEPACALLCCLWQVASHEALLMQVFSQINEPDSIYGISHASNVSASPAAHVLAKLAPGPGHGC